MRTVLFALVVITFATLSQASTSSTEELIQHINVAKVTTMVEAKKIFVEKTLEMNGKQTLEEQERHQIPIITYTLEQSIAYFNENLSGESQALVKTMADVVENIHLSSENTRKARTSAFGLDR